MKYPFLLKILDLKRVSYIMLMLTKKWVWGGRNMMKGLLILIGLCLLEIILAKLALKDKDASLMDFAEFFELDDKKEDQKWYLSGYGIQLHLSTLLKPYGFTNIKLQRSFRSVCKKQFAFACFRFIWKQLADAGYFQDVACSWPILNSTCVCRAITKNLWNGR